ncbi:MAG TPA: di-heme oxidoredictase family protein [Kofleriaceae bacterium]|nr:di-heme oxidoredictase family protein [Kofleriaceae bacterium]
MWILLGLSALPSCATSGEEETAKYDDELVLTAATPINDEGLLAFDTAVFPENPTTLLEQGDFHGYKFNGKAGGKITIAMSGERCGQPDTLVHLFGPENVDGDRGADLIRNDDFFNGIACAKDSEIVDFTLPVDGEYLIVATSFAQQGGGHYRLTLICTNNACAPSGEMTFQSSRIAQTDIDHGAFTPDELFEVGDFLFENIYGVEDGLGNALTGAPAGTNPRPNFRTVHQGGFGAPEAQSCITCHNVGGDDGAGDLNHNIFQNGDGVNRSSGLVRNPPIVLGLGLRQQIGIEMTNELQAQLAAAKSAAASSATSVTRSLSSKGVSFGSVVVTPQGFVDITNLQGVDPDLVVKPFGWKGREATLRRFVEGGFRVHFGMQSAPSIAKHCAAPDTATFGTGSNCRDPDNDGVTDEITEGQLTAMATYMGLRETPVRVPPADTNGRARATAGEQLFGSVGCGDCHVAQMRLSSTTHVEPADTTGGAGITFDLATDMKSPHPARNSDGSTTVELWSDFKRHDMGSALADSKPFKSIAPAQFITTPLWGVATSPPYMHDGRAPTLRAAILAHAGEALGARTAFAALSSDDQQKVLEFLGTLGRAPEDGVARTVEGVDVSRFTIRQANAAANFQLPAGTVVPHGGYVIVARDATRAELEAFYGRSLGSNVVYINSGAKFPQINGSETFSLLNAQGTLVEGPMAQLPSAASQIFQRVSGAAPAGTASSWTVRPASPQNATPGSGQASTGNGRVYLSELADAAGTGNFKFEFVELFVE